MTDHALSITSPPSSSARSDLPGRIWMFAAVLGVEYLPVVLFPHPWITPYHMMAPPMVFGGALLFFGRHKFTAWPRQGSYIDRRFATLHVMALLLLALTEAALLRAIVAAPFAQRATVWAWYGSILLLVGSLLATLFPGRTLLRLLRGFGEVWTYAALATLAVSAGTALLESAWDLPSSRVGVVLQTATFAGVKALLSAFRSDVVSDPSISLVGTSKFQVLVHSSCSGIQGLGLVLVLTVSWIIFARRELRLWRALLLIPVSMAANWLLNMARIAALVLLGDSGHEDIAIHGFHSEAGWLFFIVVAIGFLLAANRLTWFRKDATTAAPEFTGAAHRNVAAIYLLPFLAVLASSLVGHAASAGFDWLYPLRLAGALAALWYFRAEYRNIDWRFGWLGPLAGVLVFAMWLGLSQRQLAGTDELGLQLARLASWQRVGWISARVFAAVVTVPIVEELAFRGYLARRMVSADVEAVPFRRLGMLAVLVSSLAFGTLHGPMWIAGAIAGVVFALVAKWRNRLGEAVAAHATANLLIAAWVLARGDYRMW